MIRKAIVFPIAILLTIVVLGVAIFSGKEPLEFFDSKTQDSVRFAVIGDFGMENTAEAAVARLVKSFDPDFLTTTGDNNYPSGEASTIDRNIGQYYSDFIFPYKGEYGEGAAVNRFFPSLGNHDWGDRANNPRGADAYLDYFTLPGNERYYDVSWGPVRLFILDSDENEPDGRTADSAQAQWLREALQNAEEPHKIVVFHHPPYSSASHGPTEDMQWPFADWGATAVVSGHDHTYERLTVNGVPYFVNGLGGAAIYGFGEVLPQSEVRFGADHGAMLVEATDDRITYRFMSTTGEIVDTFAVVANSDSE